MKDFYKSKSTANRVNRQLWNEREKLRTVHPLRVYYSILYNELKKLIQRKNDGIKISCQMNGVDIFQRKITDDY